MKTGIYTLILLFMTCSGLPAEILRGMVMDDSTGAALAGANVSWQGTPIGTLTDPDGNFAIEMPDQPESTLLVQYIGFAPDTLTVTDPSFVLISLKPATIYMDEVTVVGQQIAGFIDRETAYKTEVITDAEFTKAACCDLTGCFGSNSSVEAVTTNIITHTRELRILGLSGVYNQVLIDGMPLIQGLTYTYGISSYPSTLIENIYVTKGVNSVLQGFESISGQVNVELKTPEKESPLAINAYGNSFGETQYNATISRQWKGWQTLLAAHSVQPARRIDNNADQFTDLPLLTRYMMYNKWQYGTKNDSRWYTQIGLRYLHEHRTGGQVTYDAEQDRASTQVFGQTVALTQPEIYLKTIRRLNAQHRLALFASTVYQDQEAYFGTVQYQADQFQGYANLQYERDWQTHTLRTGLSLRYLTLNEDIRFLANPLERTYDGIYNKTDVIPGVFAEQVFNWDNATVIVGVRADQHPDVGMFITPRALLKYRLLPQMDVRLSAGTGLRTVNIFAENVNLLASSRDVIIAGDLDPERAASFGANATYYYAWDAISGHLSVDVYHTRFSNQIFPDYDRDPRQAYISNFKGESASNSLQAELLIDVRETINSKIAYNFLDVYRRVDGEKIELPFNAQHKVLTTLSYRPLQSNWYVDGSLHWYGEQHLPDTSTLPADLQQPPVSEAYFTANLQLTRRWQRLEIYAGVENLFDYRQEHPILSWEDPFGPYFDTAFAWGPTKGREIYLGVRY